MCVHVLRGLLREATVCDRLMMHMGTVGEGRLAFVSTKELASSNSYLPLERSELGILARQFLLGCEHFFIFT